MPQREGVLHQQIPASGEPLGLQRDKRSDQVPAGVGMAWAEGTVSG